MNQTTAFHTPYRAQTPRFRLGVILGLAILARGFSVVRFFRSEGLTPLRSWGYENVAIALSLLHGKGFASPFFAASGPTAFLAPGYPLLIAAAMHWFGTGKLATALLIALQVVFSVLTVAVVALTARKEFGVRAGNLAGILCALCPPFLIAPLYIWDTCLSALILTVAVSLAPMLAKRPGRFPLAGIACGLAVLINPALLLAVVGVLAWAAWRARVIPWLAIFAFLLTFSAWPIRNAHAMHSFVPLRTNFGLELWAGNHKGNNGISSKNDGPMFNAGERERFIHMGELPYMREKSSLAKAYISAQPLRFVRTTVLRVGRYWSEGMIGLSTATILFSALSFCGLILCWKVRRSLFALYLIPVAVFPLPYYITHADARFQYPIDPLLAILAGYALERIVRRSSAPPTPHEVACAGEPGPLSEQCLTQQCLPSVMQVSAYGR